LLLSSRENGRRDCDSQSPENHEDGGSDIANIVVPLSLNPDLRRQKARLLGELEAED
jgi:hypothetical protein